MTVFVMELAKEPALGFQTELAKELGSEMALGWSLEIQMGSEKEFGWGSETELSTELA